MHPISILLLLLLFFHSFGIDDLFISFPYTLGVTILFLIIHHLYCQAYR